MQVNLSMFRAVFGCNGSNLDVRSKCIMLAAVLAAVLPLDIHHLLCVLVGAFGYMALQMLQPSVQHRSKKCSPKPEATSKKIVPAEKRVPWRPSASGGKHLTLAEDQKWSSLRSSTRAQPSGSAAVVVKPEIRKPSAVPVQAPTFVAEGWDAEVQELLQKISPNAESRAAVDTISRMVTCHLKQLFPNATVDGFATSNPLGGAAFGVAVPEVDIVVALDSKTCCTNRSTQDVSKQQKALIRTCTDRLVSNGAFKFRRSAFRGFEPKVTLISPVVGKSQATMPINLSVNAASPARCAAIFEACSQLDFRAQALILLVRRWAKDRGVSHAAKGHLSPYCWMLLAIYYLQVGLDSAEEGPVLPALAPFAKAGHLPKTSEDGRPACKKPAAELFKGFFQFYHQSFNWRNEAVSVLLGQRLPPDASLPVAILLHDDGKTTQIGLSIEDPFERRTNLGDGMNWLTMSRLKEELSRSYELCGRAASLAELLEPWTPPEQVHGN